MQVKITICVMLSGIKIPATRNTPKVIIDPKNGLILIEGRLLTKFPDREAFIKTVSTKVKKFLKICKKDIIINVLCDYVNTGNLRAFFSIFKMIDRYHNRDYEAIINWYAEDEDLIKIGEILADKIEMQVNIIEV